MKYSIIMLFLANKIMYIFFVLMIRHIKFIFVPGITYFFLKKLL